MEKTSFKKKIIHVILFPLFFVAILWLIELVKHLFNIQLSTLGIYPRETHGLPGILTAPLVHADVDHLYANSTSLLILSVGIFYFYNRIAYPVFFLIYIITGIGVWLIGRSAYHIGASGLVYGFASFLFFGGIISGNIRMIAMSLLVAFLYGGLVWGIFPIKPNVSYESHAFGALVGCVLAIIFRKHSPKSKNDDFDDMEDEDDEEIGGFWDYMEGDGEEWKYN